MDEKERILQRLDELVAEAKPVFNVLDGYVEGEWWVPIATSALSFIEQLTSASSTYYKQFSQHATRTGGSYSPRTAAGILEKVRDDYAKGHIRDLSELAAAEVFTDFLDMADHLHSESYYHAAASIAGAVLEDSLRRLHLKHIGPWKDDSSINKLNEGLRKAKVYDQAMWRQIQAWGDIRNPADHGEWEKVDSRQVKQMISGIRDFIARYEG